jgi:predicted glycogen debranching enzyme
MDVKLPPADSEWLESDGSGGFASGTVSGIRSRRYHGLLIPATTPPAGRTVLVNGFEAWVELGDTTFPVSSQRYNPDVVYPDGANRLVSFQVEPWPTWKFELSGGIALEQEFFVVHGSGAAALAWRLVGCESNCLADFGELRSAKLRVRPLLSGRDFHSLQRENGVFQFMPVETPGQLIWHPYDGLPAIQARYNGIYHHDPCWYRNFIYVEEQSRGLDCIEDLASPGMLEWEISTNPAVLLFSIVGAIAEPSAALACYDSLKDQERSRRRSFTAPHLSAADRYIAKRGSGRTVIAGYPWFGDWGRDTFVALRGLCITTGRFDDARDILFQWCSAVSQGMLPNRFPDHGEKPEYNSVDASLWYIVAAHDYLAKRPVRDAAESDADLRRLSGAIEAILLGYAEGTRFGIGLDDDGLLACGEPGVQLTWMDAKVGDWVVTPRIGKPVEVQALWLNALAIGSQFSPRCRELLDKGKRSFEARFWNEKGGGLFDVIDCDHVPGRTDDSLRPNQIFAVGGLPWQLIGGERARRIVQTVESNLMTPLGLRSLGREESVYAPRYEGGVHQRDGSYHQGTVWPWLIGPFVEAWLRVRENTPEAKDEARTRFLWPIRDHLKIAGLNHISEIADAEPPHTPRGCPFQAWSMGEYLRALSLL